MCCHDRPGAGRDADRADTPLNVRDLSKPRWLLSSLLIASAAMFAIGVAAERDANTNHTETGTDVIPGQTTAVHAEQSGEAGSAEGTNPDETASEGTHVETPAEASGHSESSAETILGLNLESDSLVTVAVAISLALAALTWFRNRRALLVATTAFVTIFAAFDAAEVVHQINESRSGLATLAAMVAIVHLATAVIAEQRSTTAPS